VYVAKKEQEKAGEINNKVKSVREADSKVGNNKDITKDKVKKEKKKRESDVKREDSNVEREDSDVEREDSNTKRERSDVKRERSNTESDNTDDIA
jgi:hypothetical protein